MPKNLCGNDNLLIIVLGYVRPKYTVNNTCSLGMQIIYFNFFKLIDSSFSVDHKILRKEAKVSYLLNLLFCQKKN